MAKHPSDKNRSLSQALYLIEMKLRGIGYLMEELGAEDCPRYPEELEEIHKGIGLIISGFAEEVYELKCRETRTKN